MAETASSLERLVGSDVQMSGVGALSGRICLWFVNHAAPLGGSVRLS